MESPQCTIVCRVVLLRHLVREQYYPLTVLHTQALGICCSWKVRVF